MNARIRVLGIFEPVDIKTEFFNHFLQESDPHLSIRVSEADLGLPPTFSLTRWSRTPSGSAIVSSRNGWCCRRYVVKLATEPRGVQAWKVPTRMGAAPRT